MTGPEADKGLIAIDVGGGTQDVFVYVPGQSFENCPKMVMPSPTRVVAEKIAQATEGRKPVFLSGEIMGGGSCAGAAKRHIAAGLSLYAGPRAALTFNDDLKRVEQMGIILTDEPPPEAVRIKMGDVDVEAITSALASFGVSVPRRWAVAVQDHGYSPNISNRETRFKWYREFIDSGGELDRLAFFDVPDLFTRMLAVKNVLPEALLMDTGPAAMQGALLDDEVGRQREEGLVVVNAGNYHVMCAMIRDNRVLGLLEHHTGCLDPASLRRLLERFPAGKLSNEEVLRDGGHGCYVRPDSIGRNSFRFKAVTGPNREMLRNAGTHMAVPYGDMMLTGCFGLVDAARKADVVSE